MNLKQQGPKGRLWSTVHSKGLDYDSNISSLPEPTRHHSRLRTLLRIQVWAQNLCVHPYLTQAWLPWGAVIVTELQMLLRHQGTGGPAWIFSNGKHLSSGLSGDHNCVMKVTGRQYQQVAAGPAEQQPHRWGRGLWQPLFMGAELEGAACWGETAGQRRSQAYCELWQQGLWETEVIYVTGN